MDLYGPLLDLIDLKRSISVFFDEKDFVSQRLPRSGICDY